MKRKVTWSKSVKIMTAIFLPILLIADAWMFIACFDSNGEPFIRIMHALLFLTLFATLFIVYAYSPQFVITSDSDICLRKGVGKVRIKYSDIANLGIFNTKEFSARTFGIGGICGYTGKFYTKSLGNHTEYVGDYSQAFYLILKNGKKYVFSCEDRDMLLKEVKDKINA